MAPPEADESGSSNKRPLTPQSSEANVPGGEYNFVNYNDVENAVLEDVTLPADAFLASSQRYGTITSATINLLTSMVGGGSLSLPYAFAKAGNLGFAPLLLAFCAGSAGFTLKALFDCSARASHFSKGTKMTYDTVAFVAFGSRAQYASMLMVVCVCFVGVIGYCVLLRDLGVPLAHWIAGGEDKSSRMLENMIMLTVVMIVSPLTTLKTLTALKNVGTLSILSVVILGICVVYRSSQCVHMHDSSSSSSETTNEYLMEAPYVHPQHEKVSLSYLPTSFMEFLNAFPLILNCFFCQFNAIPVHSELSYPTPKRSSRVARSVVSAACSYYLVIGFFGSIFGKCTETGYVSDNILLDFDDDDPVVTIARVCLAVVISFAFPLQVMPARDTLLRLWEQLQESKKARQRQANLNLTLAIAGETLGHPLLRDSQVDDESSVEDVDFVSMYDRPASSSVPDFEATSKIEEEMDLAYHYTRSNLQLNAATSSARISKKGCTCLPSTRRRVVVALSVFWSGAAIASLVSSIAIIWDLLGSTLVIMVGFILPSAMYLKLCHATWTFDSIMAVCIIAVFAPLMVLCTVNAVSNAIA